MRNPAQALSERVCARCGQALTWADKVAGLVETRPRCHSCRRAVQALVKKLGDELLQLAQADLWSGAHRQRLRQQFLQEGIAPEEGWAQMQKRAQAQVERVLQAAEHAPDGEAFAAPLLSTEQEISLQRVMRAADLPAQDTKRWHGRIQSLQALDRIRQGDLPQVTTSFHLAGDEVCHLDVPVLYLRSSRGKANPLAGRLVATSQKLLFLPTEGGAWTISYAHVLRVRRGPLWIDVELSVRQGHGRYTLADPARCQAILGSLTRLAKRRGLSADSPSAKPADVSDSGKDSRYIPQQVRSAVWARDKERCVECGATSYLEFDHIIPLSKGGATTLNNLQLLCRRCNLRKGNRI